MYCLYFSEEPWLIKMVCLKACPIDKPFSTASVCPRPCFKLFGFGALSVLGASGWNT